MDYTKIFYQTWNVLRRSWVIWAIGCVALSLGVLSNVLSRLGGRWAISHLILSGPGMANQLETWLLALAQPLPIVGGLLLFMVWFLLIWVVMTIGEGGMIHAAAASHHGRSARFRESLAAGWRLLVPFVAIDTVVFFPLFVLLLVIMLIGAAALFISIIWGVQSGEVTAFILPLIIGGGIALLLSFLLLPATLLTMTFRSLAFRAAALHNLGVRESIQHTWQLIREKTGPVVVITALIFGLSYLFGMVSAIVIIPLSLLEGMPNFNAITSAPGPDVFFSPLTVIAILLNGIATYGSQVLATVVTSTFWTVGYLGLTKEKYSLNANVPSQ